MSIPGFFTPVVDGNHIYVDGGLLDNLAGRRRPLDGSRTGLGLIG